LAETTLPWITEEFVAGDGYRWRYRRYLPLEGPLAEVVCLHGIQSHAGWYEHSCTRLAQAGYAVSFLDRRGAGVNEQERGDAPGFRRLLDDVAEFLQPLRAPGRPVFLMAISWGGKLAVALQRRHPGMVDGLILLCPGFRSKVRPTFRERLAIVWNRLLRPRRLFAIPLNDPELFTATPRWQQFLRDDPLALRQATARFLVESARLDAYLHFCRRHVQVPLLLLLAEHDRIIDNDRTRAFAGGFAAADRTILTCPGAHHTLEFEPNPGPWLDLVLQWLKKQGEMRR
jgi:alpha-beta hydrolase superfamily lysophospholipase